VTVGIALMLCVGFLFGVFASTAEARHTILSSLPWMALFAVVVMIPAYVSDRRYQVGFDDNGVYMRMPGFRWEALLAKGVVERDQGRRPGLLGWFGSGPVAFMAYGKIERIEADQVDQRLGGSARYSPNAALYLIGEVIPTGAYRNMVGIDVDSFALEDVHGLQRILASKRPDLTPSAWSRL